MRFIATDLPYSKNTKDVDTDKLYTNFLKLLKKQLTAKAVIGLPSTVSYKKMINNAGLKLEKEFSIYIHKSMTKRIVVMSKQMISTRVSGAFRLSTHRE